jgi:carbamoyl-phosphate synthase large subunit
MPETINILMTGGGAPGAAGILNCLRQDPSFRIIAADANPEAVAKFLADGFAVIPMAEDPNFVAAVLEVCSTNKINVVLPLVTRELSVLSANAERFYKAGVTLLVSSLQALSVANNKSSLYRFLESKGIAVPHYQVVDGAAPKDYSIEQFKNALKELGYPERPVCFKPSISNGSRGFRIIDATLNDTDLLFNQKPDSSYISATDAVRILSSAPFPELLVSEYLPGEEFSVDCVVDEENIIAIVPRLRRKMRSGISVEGEMVNDEKIIHYCERILRELKLNGNIGIQVKRNSDEEALILEINPRVQGTTVACLGAGINLPLLAVKNALNISIVPNELEVKWGTKFSRYWQETYYS